MAKNTKNSSDSLASTLGRVTKLHFMYIAAYMLSIIIFDSWNLVTYEAVVDFWTAAVALLAVNTILWYSSRLKFKSNSTYRSGILLLILADIIFAALTVYWERGLASSSVILFSVPVVTAAAVRSRSTLLATAALSAGAYSIATIRFFYQHYGESFRVELYGEIALYSAVLFIIAGLLLAITHPSEKS